MNISQEILDKHVANTQEFWNSFHFNLNAPYAYWREYKSKSLQGWVDLCWQTNHVIKAVDDLSQFPVLKGEALVATLTEEYQLLTNYRMIYSAHGSLINIPLHNLTHYDIVSSSEDRKIDLMIKYIKNGKEEILRVDKWMPDEIVRAVRNASEFDSLNEEQKQILNLSHYELVKMGYNCPKISMLPKTPEEPKKGCF
jgi:hypothetical protein